MGLCQSQIIFSHSFLKFPLESQISLGVDLRGCFEPPSETVLPKTNIDCQDILPIDHPENVTDEKAILDESQLLHPDCPTMQRYVMATRLQTVVGKKKHKLPTCDFHDLDNCMQGAFHKSMSQGELILLIEIIIPPPLYSGLLNPRKGFQFFWYYNLFCRRNSQLGRNQVNVLLSCTLCITHT